MRHVEAGTYVDVGAMKAAEGSATAALYERGWRGLNLVPSVDLADSLAHERPGDVTVKLSLDLSIDEVLDDARLHGRDVHVCRLDQRLSQSSMFTAFESNGWRPWVIVVALDPAAPSGPSAPEWEHGILTAGYRLVLFDGLNRFFVAPDHLELATMLGSPVSVFDEPWERFDRYHRRLALEHEAERAEAEADQSDAAAFAARAHAEEFERKAADVLEKLEPIASDALAWRAQVLNLPTSASLLHDRANAVAAELDATHRTISWRVTWPLRLARTASRRLSAGRSPADHE